jgi:pimeloyl-ACP methyl ester carboxylesterase
MKTIYLFSGLGADERVFKYLEFPGYHVVHVKWIAPVRNEPIAEYAKRLLQQIHTDRPILIGLSFGGIMAIEVSKLIETEKLIIIASVKTRNELPFYFRLAKYLPLYKMIPSSLMKYPNRMSNWFFGAESKEDREILATILKDTDPVFLKWAINTIVNWDNRELIKQLLHIQGDADHVLPARFVRANIIIDGGGHLMTLNKAEELNVVINRSLK